MAGEGSLIGKLDAALNHLKAVEREKNEAVAKAAALEQEIKELRGLISAAESKAEEILKGMPAGVGTKPADAFYSQPASASSSTDVKPSPSFQDFPEKTPLQNPAETRRRYTQVF